MREEKIITAVEVMQDTFHAIRVMTDRLSRLELDILYLKDQVEDIELKKILIQPPYPAYKEKESENKDAI